MKKRIVVGIVAMLLLLSAPEAKAQLLPLDIIKTAVKKVIKAIDLQIQRQQNKVIWLQNAQKTVENTMSKLKLKEISDWTDKQRALYKDYFDELYKVKTMLVYYKRVREIMELQVRIVNAYKRSWEVVRRDKHFTADEQDYMKQVYGGILEESMKNVERIEILVNSFRTQMSDAKRLELIEAVARDMETNYHDLNKFNEQNALLSLQRAKGLHDIEVVKKLYGIK
jgi:hypothetical protein